MWSRPGESTHTTRQSYPFFCFVLAVLFFSASCAKKDLPTGEFRAATREMVLAAQKIIGQKAGIAVRPEISRPAEPPKGRALSTDHIYVTLADEKNLAVLQFELDRVAMRHGLEREPARVPAADAAGRIRWEYRFGERRTHAVHIFLSSVARAAPARPGKAPPGPLLAIIIDDLGYDRLSADAVLAMLPRRSGREPYPLTVAVLPNLPYSVDVAEEAYRRGSQVLLHLPMEPSNGEARAEAAELRPGMKPEQVTRVVAAMLDTVPYAVGVNNHQGSRATADPALMMALMPALRERDLFFIDSRTTSSSVAFAAAQRARVPAAYRSVFLDDTPTRETTLRQLALAERQAREHGWAIAIGHSHPSTLAALEEFLPQLERRGIRLVYASQLVR